MPVQSWTPKLQHENLLHSRELIPLSFRCISYGFTWRALLRFAAAAHSVTLQALLLWLQTAHAAPPFYYYGPGLAFYPPLYYYPAGRQGIDATIDNVNQGLAIGVGGIISGLGDAIRGRPVISVPVAE